MVDELEPVQNNKKYYYLLGIILLAIVIVLIFLLHGFSKPQSGIDLSIKDVQIHNIENSSLSSIVVYIENLGSKQSSSSFSITSDFGGGGNQWTQSGVILPGQTITSNSGSFPSNMAINKITITIDSLNQISDINKTNNIFVYVREMKTAD